MGRYLVIEHLEAAKGVIVNIAADERERRDVMNTVSIALIVAAPVPCAMAHVRCAMVSAARLVPRLYERIAPSRAVVTSLF